MLQFLTLGHFHLVVVELLLEGGFYYRNYGMITVFGST